MKYSIIFFAISVLFMASCNEAEHAKHEESEFVVSSPIKVDTAIDKEYVCQIRASNHIEIRSLERGYLQKIFVDEGQHIKRGQQIFQIMPMVYEAEMEKSKAAVDYAGI